MRCWVQEHLLREFIEFVVRVVGIECPDPRYRPPYGAVWLEGNRLEERAWINVRTLLDHTGTLTQSWMGVSWRSRDRVEVRCELQLDDGYDGVLVRLDLAPQLADVIAQEAARFQ